MKKFLMALAGSAVLVLGACGGGGESGGESGGEGGGTYDAAAAEKVYSENCLSCHGENLEGASGPAIKGVPKDQVVSMIESGGNGMPPNIVEGEEKEMVAQWVSEQ